MYSYRNAVDHLQSLGQFGMSMGLERMRLLSEELGEPQRCFESIHVVGTNGKTSTTRMAASILSAHGLKVGAYCSPHLTDFPERIQIGEERISTEDFADSVERVVAAARNVERKLDGSDFITQFELLTAVALLAFAEHDVEVAVIEAGLGGRFDATNFLESSVQALTNVALEHTDWLGSTIAEISAEKLAVVPEGGYLVTGCLDEETLGRVEATARDREAGLSVAERDFTWSKDGEMLTVNLRRSYGQLQLRARGNFQRINFALAAAVAEVFIGSLDPAAVRRAAGEVEVPGRMEVVEEKPLYIIDGAHNPSGMKALVQSLGEVVCGQEVVAVISLLDDKDKVGVLSELAPACEAVICTQSSHRRSVPAKFLAKSCNDLGLSNVYCEPGSLEALSLARDRAGSSGAVLATGSLYLLSDLQAPATRGADSALATV